jgi:cytochrome c556
MRNPSGTFALTQACSTAVPPPRNDQGLRLWGDLTPVVSVKQLMADLLDPASDFIFNSVAEVSDEHGIVEVEPRTDADWERIRFGAVTLAEGAHLLKLRRPFAPAGDENDSKGENPAELSPAQIEAKVAADPVLWNAKIEALRNAGLEVLEIVKTKKSRELWSAGEDLDQACETCHREFWYPGEEARLNKLRGDLERRRALLSRPASR